MPELQLNPKKTALVLAGHGLSVAVLACAPFLRGVGLSAVAIPTAMTSKHLMVLEKHLGSVEC
jgi:hypothetical protein